MGAVVTADVGIGWCLRLDYGRGRLFIWDYLAIPHVKLGAGRGLRSGGCSGDWMVSKVGLRPGTTVHMGPQAEGVGMVDAMGMKWRSWGIGE